MRINFITLGCYKNLVDTEILATYLSKNKINIAFEAQAQKNDIVVINTCGFIESAKAQSIETILEYIELKQQGKIKDVYVIGCLSQRYKQELEQEIPEVSKYFGVNLKEILQSFDIDYQKELYGERLISTPSHYAYLKISEGCDRKCSFCAIPFIRGRHTSEPMDRIIKQAQVLEGKGVKELIIIAQDTSYYGYDLYNEFKLPELLQNLSEQTNIDWLRLHYLYPTPQIENILQVMADYPNICRYIDLPLQHISDNILKSMRRGYDKKFVYNLLEKIHKYLPDAVIRTAFIVGYPGETQKEYYELLNFIKEVKFDRLGVFEYSHEESTYAYKKYEDQVPEETKRERLEQIMAVQEEISALKNQKRIGETYKVLIDRKEGDFFIGRTQYDSPEIDNEVIIKASQTLKIGNFYKVKITESYEFDLLGKIIQN